MKIDRTWTISLEDNERKLLLRELEIIGIPTDLGHNPMLMQVATNRQITLPFRAIERLSLELNITRTRFIKRAPNLNFNERFPQVSGLGSGVDLILYSYNRKSA